MASNTGNPVAALTAALDDSEASVRVSAAIALLTVERAPPQANEILEKARFGSDQKHRALVRRADLRALDPDNVLFDWGFPFYAH